MLNINYMIYLALQIKINQMRLQVLFTGFLTILMMSSAAQIPFNCRGQYYLSLTKDGVVSSGLYEVKISNDGKNIYLDTISPSIGLVLNGMGYRITDNFIYGIDPQTARLRKIGMDGVAVDLGIPKGIPLDRLYYAGDVTPDGRYLLLIGLGGNPQQIVKVDLTDPQYSTSFVGLKNNNIGIVDIAFDPFSGIMYGHDLINQRLVTIDPENGNVNSNFARQPQVDQLGALFFDSFGNLYGYGAYSTFEQNKFVSINKVTGQIQLLAEGPLSTGQDGCACPYTIELQKTVEPAMTFPCTKVIYNFIVSNASGTTRSGISLSDQLPEGLRALRVVVNPFGGNDSMTENTLTIHNMTVPIGVDTIKVLVEVGEVPIGFYKNQAVLAGLPQALGSFSLSDDPRTFIEKDSTILQVIPLDLSHFDETYAICEGDSVLVDATVYGLTYLWEDGDTNPKKWLHAHNYQLKASSTCQQTVVHYIINPYSLHANIIEDTIYLQLGDYTNLHGEYSSNNQVVQVQWMAIGNENPICANCTTITVRPLYDGYYVFEVVNEVGCIRKDTVYVKVQKDRNIFAPNIISANNDGTNDVFSLVGRPEVASVKHLKIYDRWGNLVCEKNNYQLDASQGWDGTFLGREVVPGVYTWVASVVFIDGYELKMQGDVTVIR